jgi:hypothetical protein
MSIRVPQRSRTYLIGLCDHGLELSKTEIAALVNTERTLWARGAEAIDPRLRNAASKLVGRRMNDGELFNDHTS